MQFKTEPFKTTIMPFNSFHKKSIIKDISPLYLHKSLYNDLVYVSYKSEMTNKCVIEIRDKDMNKVSVANNRFDMNEDIILIDETETHLFFVSDICTIYCYNKSDTRKPELVYDNLMPDMPDTMIYYKMTANNDKHIIILVNNKVWVFNKRNREIEYTYDDIFNMNDYFFITTKDGFYLDDVNNDNIITKDRAMSKEGTIIEPLFIDAIDDTLLLCCKNTYTVPNSKNSVKKLCHDYFLFVLKYDESYIIDKENDYITTKAGDKLGTGYKLNSFQITEGYIPTCMVTLDKYAVLGLRNDNERILSFVDIPKLLGTNGSTLNVDDYKKYGTDFKNANFTTVARDNTYIYAGSENGDITIFNISDVYKTEECKLITSNNDFVVDKNDEFISFIHGSDIELTYTGTSKFFLNNVCNGKIDIISVDNRYLYAVSPRNHDITIYVRHTKPFIVHDSEILNTYITDNKYVIIYKNIIDHDDSLIKFRYRIRLITESDDIILKQWSHYHYARLEVDDQFQINLENIHDYNCKLLIEIEDINGICVSTEHELDMLLDKECRMFSNKIIIPYKTVPDKDLKMEYGLYRMINGVLVLIDSNEYNILSSYRTEWLVNITEDLVYEYDEETKTSTSKISPHINTEPVTSHNFDYIEIPVPDIDDVLYLTYTFKSEDGWEKRNPDNGEYYIYDMSDFYRPKAIGKADGGISVVDKFNILDLSYGPGVELVRSLLLRADSGNTYEMTVTNEGAVKLEKVNTISENVADNATLCFRILEQDNYELGIKAPDGKVWDFDVILTSNGRTTKSVLDDEYLFLYKNDYNIPDIESIVKALSNPIKTAYINKETINDYRLTDKYDKYGEPVNNDHKLGYTMHTEGLAEETFKDHSHFFNVYIDGLKLPSKFIEMDVDKRGEYSVKFLYDELNPNYKDKDIEIELMHSDNINTENVVKRVKIQTEKDIEDLYNGDYQLYIPTLQKGLELKEFKLFIEYPLTNSVYRIDNCNFVIKKDKLNPSKIFIKLKNYILNNIGCNLVLTTVDVDRQLMYAIDGDKEYLTSKKLDNIVTKYGENLTPKTKPYYYVPLMKYDKYGNLTYYYSDNIKSFNVVVDGYTLMPNVDYTLVNFYLHSHMPSFILFNDVLYPGTNVEIVFNDNDVSDVITLIDNDSPIVTINDGHNMFIEGCFSVFVEGKKLFKNQYRILDHQNIQLLVNNYKRVIIKFQYKGYENLSSLIEILYSRRSNPGLYSVNKTRDIDVPELTYNSYLDQIGYKDEKRIGKLYLIEAYADKCFKNKEDAIFNCNTIDDKMFDVHIDCNLNYELSYINNDIIIDSNECYNRNDFTMTSMPLDGFDMKEEDFVDDTPPIFIEQPSVKEINVVPGEVLVTFRVQDAESIFFKYEKSLDGEKYSNIDNDVVIAGNRVLVYLKNLDPGSHTVQFMAINETGLKTESENIIFVVAGDGNTNPVFNKQPKLISSVNDLNAKFMIDAYEPYGDPMYISIFINDQEIPLGEFKDHVNNNIFECEFNNYGTYRISFGLRNMENQRFRRSREFIVEFIENKAPVIEKDENGNRFILDNIDHHEQYATTHITVNDSDTDKSSIKITPYINGNIAYNYKTNIVNNMIYIYFDKLKPGDYVLKLIVDDGLTKIEDLNTIEFTLRDLTLNIEDIGYNKGIQNLKFDKFGNLSFKYTIKDQNNMGLKHEISYNGFRYTEIKPIKYNDTYVFIGNIGTKLNTITNLHVKITNSIGKTLILNYPGNAITLPKNEPIRISPDVFIEINNDERIFVRYTAINPENDLLYVYYSLDDRPWIRAYPREVNNIGSYKFAISDITKGSHTLRVKVSDKITDVISRYVSFEL